MGKPNVTSLIITHPATSRAYGGFSQGVHATGENQWGVFFFFWKHIITKVPRCPNLRKQIKLPCFFGSRTVRNRVFVLIWCDTVSPPQQLLDRFLRRLSLSKSDRKNTVVLRVSASPPARMLPIAFHHRRKGVIPDNPQQPSTLVIVDPPPPLKVEGLHSDLQIWMEINSSI